MERDYRILYLENLAGDLEQVADLLRKEYVPAELTWVEGREGFLAALDGAWSFDLLLLGDGCPGLPCAEALALAQGRCPDLPVIILCGDGGRAAALACLRHGAADYVPRSDPGRLVPAMRRAFAGNQRLAELRTAQAANLRLSSLLRTVLESTREGLLVTDLAGRITTYNRKFMNLCGIPEYVMAPMELDRVLQFLQDQFPDSGGFLREVRQLGGLGERQAAGLLAGEGRALEAQSRPQRLGGETVGRVLSFAESGGRGPEREAPAVPADLLEAARSGRVVPWYLTEEDLIISEKGLGLLGLPPGGLPRDLPALEALIHPGDLDSFRKALERPGPAPLELSLKRGDGAWIRTRWTLKRGPEGYRGVFMEIPAAAAPSL